HGGAVGGRVVVAVDARRAPVDEGVEDEREQVVRARVGDVTVGRTDDVEVAQRGVGEAGGDALRAQQPLADELGFPVGRGGVLGGVFRHEGLVGVAVDGGGGGEHDPADPRLLHGGEQDARAFDVLPVGVQRLLHGDARVLVAGDVDDAL